MLDIDAQFALGQVANVAVASQHSKATAKEFLDSIGLGRALNDNNILIHTILIVAIYLGYASGFSTKPGSGCQVSIYKFLYK